MSNFQITEVFAGLLQNPHSWRAEQELLMLTAKQFLTWVAAQDTCGVTNWPPIEGLPNPDFKYKLLPVKIDMKVAGVPRISRTQRCSNTHVDVLFTQRVNSNEKQLKKKPLHAVCTRDFSGILCFRKRNSTLNHRLTWGESRLPLALRARSNTATEAKRGLCPPPLPVPPISFHCECVVGLPWSPRGNG